MNLVYEGLKPISAGERLPLVCWASDAVSFSHPLSSVIASHLFRCNQQMSTSKYVQGLRHKHTW